jgi:hypothetical protein
MLKLKNTQEQIELMKAIGSRSKSVSDPAKEAFAAFVGPVIQELLTLAGSSGLIYTDVPFDEDESPSYPLDLYFDNQKIGYVTVWSQSMAGGLPTSTDVSAEQDMKFDTYNLQSAVSWRLKYARRGNLGVAAKAIERMAQEVLRLQERNAWSVVLKALAEASTSNIQPLGQGLGYTDGGTSTTYGNSDLKHVIRSTDTSTFLLEDLNALMTRMRRVNSAWDSGTPISAFSSGITDLFCSPEVKQDIRSFAYEPLNTASNARGSAAGDHAGIALPENFREQIFKNAGLQEIYGVNIVELNELGTGQKYNKIFDFYAGSTSFTRVDGTNGTTFAEASDQILVGVDNSKEALLRPVATRSDGKGGVSTFNTQVDDQFTSRSDKFGVYGEMEEGRITLDSRGIAGILLG